MKWITEQEARSMASFEQLFASACEQVKGEVRKRGGNVMIGHVISPSRPFAGCRVYTAD